MNKCVKVNKVLVRGLRSWNNILLSGHNKWSSIKHDKAKNDVERNKLFSKFAQRIALAVKLSGGNIDPNLNIRLATAIELANKNNVTKKVIENAIKKGAGTSSANKNGSSMESCIYEGMGPGGVAFVVEALTDNKNRTIGFVRSAFTKANGSMTPTLYFFDKKGYVVVKPPLDLDNDEDKLLEKVLEIDGVEDIEKIEDEDEDEDENQQIYGNTTFEISTEPTMTNNVASALKTNGFRITEVGMAYISKKDMLVQVSDEDTKQKIQKFMTVLDEIEDVTDIYTNMSD